MGRREAGRQGQEEVLSLGMPIDSPKKNTPAGQYYYYFHMREADPFKCCIICPVQYQPSQNLRFEEMRVQLIADTRRNKSVWTHTHSTVRISTRFSQYNLSKKKISSALVCVPKSLRTVLIKPGTLRLYIYPPPPSPPTF